MLDKKTEAVLHTLNEFIGNGYKVVAKAEIAERLPEKYKMDNAELSSVIGYLKEKEFVTVKYQDKEEICLAVTVRASNYLENKKNEVSKAELTLKQNGITFAVAFIGAFLGALLAAIIGKLL